MSDHSRANGGHGGSHGYRAASRQSLWAAFILIGSFMVIEVVGGVLSNSLALLADAGHMVTDAAAIGLALFAIWVATRPASSNRTFGFHRTEILAALVNALSLWIIAGWIFFEAYRRFLDQPEVQGFTMLSVGAIGLVVNVGAAWVLKRSAGESLNVEGAFLHVIGDLLGSVAVIAGALLIITLGWFVADPVFGVIIGVIMIGSSGRLLWKVLHVLMEGTPATVDLQHLCQQLERVEGVSGVHDIHAWSITTGYEVLSAHVTTEADLEVDTDVLLHSLRQIASDDFGLGHVTIQLERSPEDCEEDHHVEHGRIRS